MMAIRGAMLRRGTRAFWHMTLGNLLIGFVVVVGASILNALLAAVGFIALVLMFAGIFMLVWFAVIVTAIANYAVICEASDRPTKFGSVMGCAKTERTASRSQPGNPVYGVLFPEHGYLIRAKWAWPRHGYCLAGR